VRERNALGVRVVGSRTRDIFWWCEWVVTGCLPFSFVERRMARLNSSPTAICEEMLKLYLTSIY